MLQNEQIVDHYLQYLKYKHFEDTKDTGFPPLRPIQEVKDIIEASDVYRLLVHMPKGRNMHTHESKYKDIFIIPYYGRSLVACALL